MSEQAIGIFRKEDSIMFFLCCYFTEPDIGHYTDNS